MAEIASLRASLKALQSFFQLTTGQILLKCRTVAKILAAHTSDEDMMIDYIEKWHIHAALVAAL